MYLFDVYSIDPKVISISRKYRLVKRSEKPLSLSDASQYGAELNSQGHLVELRRSVSEDEPVGRVGVTWENSV